MRTLWASITAVMLLSLAGCDEQRTTGEVEDEQRTTGEVEDEPSSTASDLQPEPKTALTGAKVFDGTGADPIENAVVLLERDRIQAVGPASEVDVPSDALVVDVAGKWIVPGLIDSHVHFFQSGGVYTRPDIVDLRHVRPYEEEMERIKANLDDTFRRTLASGITAVVDVGGPMWNFEVREQSRASVFAPRVAVAGPLVSTVERPQMDVGDPPIIKADSPDAARELVRRQLAKQPDLIKVWFIVAEDQGVAATVDMLEAVVDESHDAGVRVAVHATGVESARAAVEAGAEILVHSVHDGPLDDALIAEMKERGTILIPTLMVGEGYAEVLGRMPELTGAERRLGDPKAIASWAELGALSDEPPEQAEARIARHRKRGPIMRDNLKRLHEAGVIIAAGTDAGNIGTLHGASMHRELELMAQAGLSPRDILIAATRDAAKVFAAEPEIGTLEPGKLADMLVLEADPLSDLENLERLALVVKGGVVLEPARIHPPNPAWVVQEQLEAYNARDIDRFAGTYAEDCVITRHPSGEAVATGREEVRQRWGDMFQKSPDLNCRIVERIVEGGMVIDHELVTGIRDRPDVRAVAIYEVESGLIQRVWFLPHD